jgi:hypothetical protein
MPSSGYRKFYELRASACQIGSFICIGLALAVRPAQAIAERAA